MEKEKHIKHFMSARRDFMHINPLLIEIPAYQRDLNHEKINKMCSQWNPLLVEPIKVSQRKNGKLVVMDGQHTLAAWIKVNEDAPIAAIVYYGLSYEEEARMFKEFNMNKTKVSFNENLKAMYEAKGAAAVAYVKALNASGINFQVKGDGLTCHSTVSDWWLRMSDDCFVRGLKCLKNYMPYDKQKYSAQILAGYLMFIAAYKEDINFIWLTKVLSKVNASEIEVDGIKSYTEVYRKTPTGKDRKFHYQCALAFLKKYNYRAPEEAKLDYELLQIKKCEGFRAEPDKTKVLNI